MSKRLLLVIGLVAAVVAVVLLASDDKGFDDGYRVRATSTTAASWSRARKSASPAPPSARSNPSR